MTDSQTPVPPVIGREPGGFLQITSTHWMRWDAITRVKNVGVVFDGGGHSNYVVKVFQDGGHCAARGFPAPSEAADWINALFAAIEHERQQAQGRPSALVDWGCTSREQAGRVAMHQWQPARDWGDPPVDHRPRTLTLRERLHGAVHILFRRPRQ